MPEEVKWIKIVTGLFDDEKMLLIESMPDADAIIVIWLKMLCLAGKNNNSGVFKLAGMPYTDEMFATIFRRPLNTVRLALNVFERMGMVINVNGVYTIPNWGKHQSLDALEASRAATRNRVSRYRDKQKKLAEAPESEGCNVTERYSNVTVTQTDKSRLDKIRLDEIRLEDISSSSSSRACEEDDLPRDEMVIYATNNLQPMSPNNLTELISFRDSLSDDMIIYGIDCACSNGIRNYSYVKRILNAFIDKGFKTIGEVKAAEDKRSAEKAEQERRAEQKRSAPGKDEYDFRPQPTGNPFADCPD